VQAQAVADAVQVVVETAAWADAAAADITEVV